MISYKMKKTIKLGLTDRHAFPSPFEDWVVSYGKISVFKSLKAIWFPAPLEGWLGSYK